VREPGRLLIVLHREEPAAIQALQAIRARYRETFGQQSVLRVDSASCASF
jgi:hypothetical protein